MYIMRQSACLVVNLIMVSISDLRHEISNNVVCETSKDYDQPAHMRSLIRAFAFAKIFYECLASD